MTILFIDCYDSFTYNLVNLIKLSLSHQEVVVLHNNQMPLHELLEIVESFDAVIIGPGPGSPLNPEDSGVIDGLWKKGLRIPIFGICFGLQSLVHAYDGQIKRLNEPQHGQYGTVHHNGSKLFAGILQDYKVIRYHSLHAVVDSSSLEVLAVSQEDDCTMAVAHKQLPYYAVQFHPESVLSEHGDKLIQNFWSIAQTFNADRVITPTQASLSKGVSITPLLPNYVKSNHRPTIKALPGQGYQSLRVCEHLYTSGQKFVLLDSRASPGEWSIIGLVDESTIQISCKGDTTFIGPHGMPDTQKKQLKGDTWEHLAQFMSPRLLSGTFDLPFIGGLTGYVTYERCCGTTSASASDLSFLFIENCILIRNDGAAFTVGNVGEVIQEDITVNEIPTFRVSVPKKDTYEAKIDSCKSYLRSGDSYELCLTDQTQIEFENAIDPWNLYKRIATRNPAPYAVFMDFEDTLVGSSPERFMSWSATGKCQFRPIKGTVKKVPGIDLKAATEILTSKKEQGENLMIVDLIRHDLGQLLDTVTCPQTMRIEEYKTVYQLVSVIEGELSTQSRYAGIDVLRNSLPPGSMTGAPKVRSVEILRHLEEQPRGLYSGVAGYWSLHDAADWSVIIRSAFQYKGESKKWRMGAGGAITILSDNEAEYDEMRTKLDSAFQAFF